jgi:hypothetical protein
MIRQFFAAASIALAAAAVPLFGVGPFATAAPGDTYISNPVTDPADQAFCDDQAALANNLSAKRRLRARRRGRLFGEHERLPHLHVPSLVVAVHCRIGNRTFILRRVPRTVEP